MNNDEWLPIEEAPKDNSRIELWIPKADEHRPGFPVFGEWCADQFAQKPRPFWTNDLAGSLGVTYVRTRQPTHYRLASTGPKY